MNLAHAEVGKNTKNVAVRENKLNIIGFNLIPYLVK